MRVIERSIEYHSRNDVIRITPLFDLHLGNAATDERLIKRHIETIAANPLHFWIGGGDYGEFINRSDKRYRETQVASWLHGVDDLAMRIGDRCIDMLSPIKDKCLGLLRGNHENDMLKKYERDVYARMVDALKPSHDVPIRLGWQGFIRLILRRMVDEGKRRADSWTVVIYCHHGYGGGRLEGGDALALGRIFKSYNCDVGLMGHRHKKHVLPLMHVGPARKGTRIKERYQVAAFCGSFLRGYSEDEVYPEEKGLPPLPLGSVEIKLIPDGQVIKIEI